MLMYCNMYKVYSVHVGPFMPNICLNGPLRVGYVHHLWKILDIDISAHLFLGPFYRILDNFKYFAET